MFPGLVARIRANSVQSRPSLRGDFCVSDGGGGNVSLGSWIVEVLKTPGGAAAVSACAALSGALLTARVQRSNHREASIERQEDQLREAVADVLASRWTWPNSLDALASVIAAADRSTAEGNTAFRADYEAALDDFDRESVELARRVERVRLLTRQVKIHTALGRIDELGKVAWRCATDEGRPSGQGLQQIDDPFSHYADQMVDALKYLSGQTQLLTARHGLDNPVQPDHDLSRRTVRRFRTRAVREGTGYVSTIEAELPWWRYYPRKFRQRLARYGD
ncbi:hypothetical protein GS443_14170 [Rhodococcus hoagii]|nr:hypothetical protein [Prescottella equi]